MNETKAKNKDCRLFGPLVKNDGSTWWSKCAGSGCVHWEWDEVKTIPANASGPLGIVYINDSETDGYCGPQHGPR